jgi:hypothetical protein
MKEVVQLYVGETPSDGSEDTYSLWVDTLYDSVERARENFPEEVYREATVETPEYERFEYASEN